MEAPQDTFEMEMEMEMKYVELDMEINDLKIQSEKKKMNEYIDRGIAELTRQVHSSPLREGGGGNLSMSVMAKESTSDCERSEVIK
jgi:hypothetical protein